MKLNTVAIKTILNLKSLRFVHLNVLGYFAFKHITWLIKMKKIVKIHSNKEMQMKPTIV